MTVAVLTLAHGRHAHLRGLLDALGQQTRPPDLVVVAAMGDPGVHEVVAAGSPLPDATLVLDLPLVGTELPLARARNLLAEAAIARGATVLVFLDVDCLAGPRLVEVYDDACATPAPEAGPRVFAGPVHYLSPAPEGGYTAADLAASQPHPARPVPTEALETAADVLLFWSLSFAVTAADWQAVGGFDEAYVGYGGEDTDFAMRLDRSGGHLVWVRDAPAHHQHHEIESPPVRHVVAIARNANLFHDRWGFFPMLGWLEELERRGLAHRVTPTGRPARWLPTAPGDRGRRTS